MAKNALSAGAYDDAIGYLEQLIGWFGESTQKVTIGQMEFNYFHLALCHYLLGHFTESEKAFDVYLQKYPKGPNAVGAAVYRCDGFRYQGKHDKARDEYEKVLKNYPMDSDWETDIHCSMVRCYPGQR